jgi:hypothetical protein
MSCIICIHFSNTSSNILEHIHKVYSGLYTRSQLTRILRKSSEIHFFQMVYSNFTQFGHMTELSECELVLQKTSKERYFA